MSTTSSRRKHKIYFAYGGNIHLKQMVKRCPCARYLGVARLPGYRWQINERGYANIIAVSTETETRESPAPVQGLCYLISVEDEGKLDRSEGVPTAYQKRILSVELILPKASLVGRDVGEIMNFSTEELRAGSGRGEKEVVKALVYVSKDYTTDGLPRAEYAARMRLGLSNALDMGMSREYARTIETVLAAGVRGAGAGAGGVSSPPAASPRPQPRPSTTAAPRASPPSTAPAPTYYFAFGSNMVLTQMAGRCPGSKVFAKGILPGYRWHINERGVANIVATPPHDGSSVVQGILFTLSPKDISALDKYEGVAKGYYDRILLRVKVEPLAVDGLKGVKTAVAAGKLASNSQAEARGQGRQRQGQGQHRQPSNKTSAKEVEALVYLSSQYKKDGLIRAEDAGRMQLAMADALKLGVDEAYLRASLRPWVLGVEEEVVLDQGKRKIIVREPAGGAAQVGESPEGRRIIERVPFGTESQAAA
ncbi:hypothetical protein BDW71DRAFT_185277 [Aspergillus fruticulosus]